MTTNTTTDYLIQTIEDVDATERQRPWANIDAFIADALRLNGLARRSGNPAAIEAVEVLLIRAERYAVGRERFRNQHLDY